MGIRNCREIKTSIRKSQLMLAFSLSRKAKQLELLITKMVELFIKLLKALLAAYRNVLFD